MIWVYAAWGLFGGLAVEALEFLRAIRRAAGMPWKNKDGTRNRAEPGPGALVISVLIRMGIGGGLAAAAGASGQVSGPLAAIAIGVAAPLIIEQFGAHVPALEGTSTGAAPVPRADSHPVSLAGMRTAGQHGPAERETHALVVHESRYPGLGAHLAQLDDDLTTGRIAADDYLRLRAAVIARTVAERRTHWAERAADGDSTRMPVRSGSTEPDEEAPVVGMPPPAGHDDAERTQAQTGPPSPPDYAGGEPHAPWGGEVAGTRDAGWRQGPEFFESQPGARRLGGLITALTRRSPAFHK